MTTYNAHDVRRVAVESFCDPRTVNRYLRGEAVRHTVKARIEAAMARLGMALPIQAPAPGAAAQ